MLVKRVLLQTRLVAINTDLNRCGQSGHVTSILSPRMINFKLSGVTEFGKDRLWNVRVTGLLFSRCGLWILGIQLGIGRLI